MTEVRDTKEERKVVINTHKQKTAEIEV